MKKAKVLVTVCALILAAGVVWAETQIGEIKWSQLPLLDEYGYDISSETLVPSVAAADWECRDPRAVIAVHWWGSHWISSAGFLTSYSNSFIDPSLALGAPLLPDVVDGFNVAFYAESTR